MQPHPSYRPGSHRCRAATFYSLTLHPVSLAFVGSVTLSKYQRPKSLLWFR
jgi:hypothetical protein